MPKVGLLMTTTLAAMAMGTGADATTVHKCRLRDGGVVYQGMECATGARTLSRWEAAPDPLVDSPPLPARSSQPSRRRTTAARARRPVRAESADPCSAAKARRDSIERRVGLARTYELLSALQRDVYDACR